jgi:RES domain
MPPGNPPEERARPNFRQLPAGTYLWRVAGTSLPDTIVFREKLAHDPAPGDAEQFSRFGPTADCPYPYCYAATDDLSALCEVLMQDVPYSAPERYLPAKEIVRRRLVMLETMRPLTLVSLLHIEDLAAARQDTWLIHAEKPEYAQTRRWGHWLRNSAGPDGRPPDGLIWPSKRQPDGQALVLFGDRCAGSVARAPFGPRAFGDNADGRAWLDRRLRLLRIGVAPQEHAK